MRYVEPYPIARWDCGLGYYLRNTEAEVLVAAIIEKHMVWDDDGRMEIADLCDMRRER